MDIFELSGEKIRKLREDRGWSRETLSEKSGIPPRTIQDIETGKVKNPGIDTIKPLIKAINPATDRHAVKKANSIISLITRLPSLNEEELGDVDGFIDDLIARRLKNRSTTGAL